MRIIIYTIVFVLINSLSSFGANYYWVGGNGSWSQYSTHWATSSGGTTFHIQVPTSNDNVYFDNNSFTGAGQTVHMDIAGVCATMDWTGADAVYSGATNGPRLSGSAQLEIFGSLIMATNLRPFTYNGVIRFLSTGTGNTIDGKGFNFSNHLGRIALSFEGTGSWTFTGAFNTNGGIDHRSGTLNFGTQTVTMGFLKSNSGSIRTLNLDGGTIVLTGPAKDAWDPNLWEVNTSGLTMNAGTSNIIVDFRNVHSGWETTIGWRACFLGGGAIYNNITSSSRTVLALFHNNTIANLRCNGKAEIKGSNTITTSMTLTKGYEYIFENYSTQTFSSGAILNANGDCSGLINIKSSGIVSGAHANFSASSWTGSTLNYSVIFNTSFTPTITANNSVDNGLNTGITFVALTGKSLYWVGGTGNWNNGNMWSLTSGGAPSGCVPTPVDDVFFDANSFTAAGQQVIIDSTNAYCKNMSWTGATNTPTFKSNGVLQVSLNVYGSLTFITGMVNSLQKYTYFWGSATHTITSAGQTFKGCVTFTGTGTYSLNDGLEVRGVDGTMGTGILSLHGGTFTTNNFYVRAKRFDAPDRGLNRTMNMGSSVFTIYNDNPDWSDERCWYINMSRMTLNSGTSTINVSNLALNVRTIFEGGGLTYYNVNFTNTEVTVRILNSNTTFHNLAFSGNANIENSIFINNSITFSPGKTYTIFDGITINLVGSAVLNANGNCSNYIIIKSSGSSQGIFSKTSGTVSVNYVTLQNSNATGGATFTASNSIDQGGNTGWTIGGSPARDLYWVGGTGNWSDPNKWSTTSGGAGGACPPTLADNVFFDANSFTATGQSVTIDVNPAACKNMDWTGSLYTPSFVSPTTNALHIYGSLRFVSNMIVTNFRGEVHFLGSGSNTITSAGLVLQNDRFYFNSNTGTYTFLDNFSTSNDHDNRGRVDLVSGTLNTNNVNVLFGAFNSNYTNARTLNLGSSNVNIRGRTCWCWPDWDTRGANLTLNAGTSTISLPAAERGGGGAHSYLGDLSYHKVTAHLLDGNDNSKITIYGNNTFKVLNLTSTTLINGSNTFIDTLYFTPDHVYTFQNGSTQAFGANTHVGAVGTGAGPIYVQSVTSGTSVFWTKPSGRVCADYIYIRDIHASGGATFTGGGNANDQGGNSGWNFDPYPVAGDGVLSGADTLCAGESAVLTFNLTGAFPKSIIYSDGTTNDTISNIMSSPVTATVTPSTTVTFGILSIEVDMCFAGAVAKSGTATIKVLDGTAGLWTGMVDTNWFVCKNWANGSIPTTSTNVMIPGTAAKMPLIGGPGAVCNNIEIATSASLSMPPSTSTLNVYGNFKNDGTFNQGLGTVEFSGTALSDISGASTIRFYNLIQSNSVGVQLSRNINVQNVLTINNGYINLNAMTLTVENPAISAVVRNAGYILSENTSNLSKVTWQIGSTTGQHVYPFGKPGYYLPFTMDVTAGTIGDVTVSTYATASDNTSYPVTPEAVASSSFNSYTDNISNIVDRFWQIDKNGASGTANVTFCYADNEIPTNGETGLEAYRYSTVVSKWQKPALTQAQNLASNTVTISGLTNFSPWTLILPTSPLPIEFISFDAKEDNNNAKLTWVTNHDPNISKCIIERSKDGINFELAGFVSTNNLTGVQTFSFIDEENIQGVYYYRVGLVYNGGLVKYSRIESVNVSSGKNYFEVFPSPTAASDVRILVKQNNDEPVLIEFYNSLGMVMYSEVINLENGKLNATFDLTSSLTPGVYLVVGSNKNQTYKRRIIIR